MMLLLFLLMLLAVILAWLGWRRSVLMCLSITLILAAIFFYSDITTHLTIDL
jgi:hypothetical protein